MEEGLNIFHIPSWYPSEESPTPGYFIREQISLLAEEFPEHAHGLFHWGQNDPNYLLPISAPIQSLGKLLHGQNRQLTYKVVRDNFLEYNKPTFTWTKKIAAGNIEEIISSNKEALEAFRSSHGPVKLIHAHISYPAGYIASRLSTQLDIPYIISEHMGPFPFASLRKKNGDPTDEIQLALRSASIVTAPSQFLAKQLRAFTSTKIEVVPNFINFQTYALDESIHLPFRIAFLGRLEASKGLRVLMEALQQLNSFDWECTIAGEGSLASSLQSWIDANGFSRKIKLKGFLPTHQEKVNFLKQSDCLVLPSYHENFGIVLIEAMACGKPVISTDCGGPAEIIHANNGLLIEKGNASELASSLLQIFKTRTTYKDAQIRDHAKARYDISVVGKQLLEVYHTVAGQESK